MVQTGNFTSCLCATTDGCSAVSQQFVMIKESGIKDYQSNSCLKMLPKYGLVYQSDAIV